MAEHQRTFDWGDAPPSPPAPLPAVRPLADRLREWARLAIRLGTSSWKYPGWIGSVYDPARYHRRGRFSRKHFEQTCLAEYAAVFPTVGGDFSFYQFPTDAAWARLFDQVPDGFAMSLKVPEDLTVERFPTLPRYGRRAGRSNPDFMNPAVLADRFLALLEPYRRKLGVLMFEFGTFRDGAMAEPPRFAEALSRFLSRLPTDRFDFAVEVRNPAFLTGGTDYLDCLRAHRTAHCFNSWTRMPPILEQLATPGVFTAPHAVARLLLRPGRAYQQAVDLFSPYQVLREPYPEGRAALKALIEQCLERRQALFAFVNNRFEGNAVETIRAVIDDLA